MKNFYRSMILFMVSFVAIICLSAQVQAAAGDDCNIDADCDDTLFCTGVESCSSEGSICVVGSDPCEATSTTPVCDEETDMCVEAECEAWPDCDDGNLCTGAICTDGKCSNPEVDCGDDVCDELDGSCVECLIDDDCEEDETCGDNMCIADGCPEGTPDEVLTFDEDGDCLLNKDELKNYSSTLKADQKADKTALKEKQSLEKDEYKEIKTNYSTK